METKANRLFWLLGGFFLCNVLLAEFLGGKIFSLEATIGLQTLEFNVLGIEFSGINLTAGVIMWPFVFIMTDMINEYFGHKGVRFLTYLATALVVYAFAMIFAAIEVPPASFWANDDLTGLSRDLAFRSTLGQGLWIIAGSLTAFLVGQIVDVGVFHWVRRRTGQRWMWLRSTGSTLVSQLVDSFVVLFIAFYVSGMWDFQTVMAIALVNYAYKGLVALLLTPVLYLLHTAIDRWLGEGLANELKAKAALR
jgi:uncharacterized integral membrane protein (TIGR00697 family)